ncbi:MAG: hypothetical protein HFJ28_01460 [Clostridia bacterium]|jgi:hypothetical protein|nr:hypothetical protein [Clostridia bacterium]
MENKKVILLVVSFIMAISLILNIVLVIKTENRGVDLCFSDEVRANNAALDYLLSGNHNSKSLADRLHYVYSMNNLYKESENKIIYVVFENTEYKIMNDKQLENLQNQVKNYKGSYYVEVYADEETGYSNKVILNKI